MRSTSVMKAGLIAGLTFGVMTASTQIQFAQQQAQPPAAVPVAGQQAPRGGGQRGPDPRAQQRTYLFQETNEQMPYALYVSSKVSKDKKNPLIVSLHGLGGTQNTMVGASNGAIDLAEQGGYIYVSPMGYSCGGWYGIPLGAPRGGGAGRGAGAPGAGAPQGAPPAAPQAAAPQGGAPQAGAPQRGAGGRGGGCAGGGTAVTDAAKVREMSEKEVLTVLDMMKKEFNVDERRTYLMGHSMGGSGTLYLGAKHAPIWAAVAAIAPPGALGAGSADGLAAAKVPVFVVQGDMDTAVPVAGTRRYIDRLKELNATYEYLEIPGGDHGNVIAIGMPDIFKFFDKHSKPAR